MSPSHVVDSKLSLSAPMSSEVPSNGTSMASSLSGIDNGQERRSSLPIWSRFDLLEHGLIIGLVAIAVITTVVIAFTWRAVRRRQRKKSDQLASMFPKPGLNGHGGPGTSRPPSYGMRPTQTIEFVVPTINVPETTTFTVTEDSMSDSDCFGVTSGSDRESGAGPSRRHRHPAGRYVISPGDINKRLYLDCEQRRKNQMGRVNFVLHYSFFRQQLLVTLLSACELPLSVKKGHVNPFAKVRLLPEKTPKFVTKMQRNNPNPLFNELFIFPAKKQSLDSRILRISVWHYDRFSRKYFIGQIHYKLSEAGITSTVDSDVITDEIWCPLKGANQHLTAE